TKRNAFRRASRRCPMPAPPRWLLVLAPQQQLDPFSDERRGVAVLRVRRHLPHPVPRCLVQAEGDDARLSCHSLSSFPGGRGPWHGLLTAENSKSGRLYYLWAA